MRTWFRWRTSREQWHANEHMAELKKSASYCLTFKLRVQHLPSYDSAVTLKTGQFFFFYFYFMLTHIQVASSTSSDSAVTLKTGHFSFSIFISRESETKNEARYYYTTIYIYINIWSTLCFRRRNIVKKRLDSGTELLCTLPAESKRSCGRKSLVVFLFIQTLRCQPFLELLRASSAISLCNLPFLLERSFRSCL